VYLKNILVPIGERMLWLDKFPFLWKLQFGQANWTFGTEVPRYYCGKHDFAPSICYELAFAHFMQRANFELPDGNLARRITMSMSPMTLGLALPMAPGCME
jgi:hypothetical protein